MCRRFLFARLVGCGRRPPRPIHHRLSRTRPKAIIQFVIEKYRHNNGRSTSGPEQKPGGDVLILISYYLVIGFQELYIRKLYNQFKLFVYMYA